MEMSFYAETVVERLKSYKPTLRRIEQLRYELDNPSFIDENDVIESLALGIDSEGQVRKHGGYMSDKTMAIALQYRIQRNAWKPRQ